MKQIRALKANFIAYRIIFSYWKLHLLSKIVGVSYKTKRIEKLHIKNALRIKNGIANLGGLFVKVGQLISILTNFLPDAFKEPLESLQDELPARKIPEIKRIIESELGESFNSIFNSFDENPLGTASIGQTHKATLKDGSQVVVKVQHADIQKIASIDLAIIKSLVRQISFLFKIQGLDYIYEQVSLLIQEELDYTHEATQSQVISKNIEANKGIVIPKVFENYSTSKVLTTEFFEGVKITNLGQLKAWNLDENSLAEKLVEVYFKMIFEDQLYHADPHPGNILVNEAGIICLIDFGAVSKLSPTIKAEFPKLIIAVTKQDTTASVDCLRQMGFIGPGRDATIFAENLIRTAQNFIRNEIKIDQFSLEGISIDPNNKALSNFLKDLKIRDLTASIQIPKDWILLQRALLLLVGTANQLSPQLNPILAVKPYVKKMVISESGGLHKIIINTIKSQASLLISLPNQLAKTLNTINNEGMRVQDSNQAKAFERIQSAIVLLSYSILSVGFFYLSKVYIDEQYEQLFFYGGVIFTLFIVKKILFPKRTGW